MEENQQKYGKDDLWIFFADIDYIVYDRKVMYIVKKNKRVEKFTFPKAAPPP